MRYKVWYMRPEFFRDGTMGYDWLRERGQVPNPKELEKTHIFLKEEEATGLENLYIKMQGEVWSPHGEARNLIRGLGLRHTSMSMGDIAVDEHGVVAMVDRFGYRELS